MRQIKTLKFDISKNICLNLGFAMANLITDDLIRINRNDVSEIILSYINEIRGDRTRTALARKILELALAQGKQNLAQAK